jgi:co-chaperonin GroES (HSP10)
LKAGDIVVLPTYGGTTVHLNDGKDDSMVLLRESEILAKVVDA